ncbi:unnamed protein product, partial [Larinioides sclopetarius]
NQIALNGVVSVHTCVGCIKLRNLPLLSVLMQNFFYSFIFNLSKFRKSCGEFKFNCHLVSIKIGMCFAANR